MVPDSPADADRSAASARPTADDADEHGDDALDSDTLDSDDIYTLVYYATREAIWDVIGTATLILFYLVLAAICLSIAVGGIGPFLRGTATISALAVGLVALAVGLFAAYRVYALVAE